MTEDTVTPERPEPPSQAAGGPIQKLCQEVGLPYDEATMERPEVLFGFVLKLMDIHIEMLEWRKVAAGQTPSSEFAAYFGSMQMALKISSSSGAQSVLPFVEMISDKLHEFGEDDHDLNLLQMYCSAITYGMEKPCQSRHAAHAADALFQTKYKFSLHDRWTSEFSKMWARGVLAEVLQPYAASWLLRGCPGWMESALREMSVLQAASGATFTRDLEVLKKWAPQPAKGDALPSEPQPIDMVLFCPACNMQHIDKPNEKMGWHNLPHKTHECQNEECPGRGTPDRGYLWRPSQHPTNGVASIRGPGEGPKRVTRTDQTKPHYHRILDHL